MKRQRVRASNPKILKAARELSKKLSRKKIPHALIGGLAVGAYGYERATADADFLVSAEAQSDLAGDLLGGEVQGKTIIYKGVTIDLLFPSADEQFLEAAIRRAPSSGGIPIIPKEVLIYMKMVAGRARDSGDVVELLKRGKIDQKKVFSYLKTHRPDLIDDFSSLIDQATLEGD